MRRWGRTLSAVFAAGVLWTGIACAEDADDEFLRSYAQCLTDSNGVLHRTHLANRVGTVPLDSQGIELWLRGSLERGETTIDEMRANYIRHCK